MGDEKVLAAIEQVELDAIAGFQYAQRELRVKAGSKISLTFPNLDLSMTHNAVIVQPDRLTTIMDASMKLAVSPEGLAKHYVPEDKEGIALSPLLQSGNSYVMYFRSPGTPGAYLYLCTYADIGW